MVANARVVICQYSTLAFVGLALGKEVHSYFDLDDLRRLLPLQGGTAAARIADVCRDLLAAYAASGTTDAGRSRAAATPHASCMQAGIPAVEATS